MMHQKIIAAPTLPQELIDRTIALTYTADEIETLLYFARSTLEGLEARCVRDQNALANVGDWRSIRDMLSLIERNADTVKEVAEAVLNAPAV